MRAYASNFKEEYLYENHSQIIFKHSLFDLGESIENMTVLIKELDKNRIINEKKVADLEANIFKKCKMEELNNNWLSFEKKIKTEVNNYLA